MEKELKRLFGHDTFRSKQKDIVDASLNNENIIVLMPTGGGKSLCYQFPATQVEGITIVISPLKSLIQDQIDSLKKKKINVCSFYGDTSFHDKQDLMINMSEYKYLLIYTTPETLSNDYSFVCKLQEMYEKNKLKRIVIDEAHCISTWGHDFRPSYRSISNLSEAFPEIPFIALTATATPKVVSDIKDNLNLRKPKIFSQSFFRNNLEIKTFERDSKSKDQIVNLITNKHKNQTGIIYCLSRKNCETMSLYLNQNGIDSKFYHADIKSSERIKIQEDWSAGKVKVIVATIAFGMGIDKPDVRFVIHHNLPKSLESYYQEIGRAGRDGLDSTCYMFYNYQDKIILQKMINDRDISKLIEIVGFFENIVDCRHYILSNYFGENKDFKCKNKCDNCLRDKSNLQKIDITKHALDIFKEINFMGPKASKNAIKKSLKDQYDPKLIDRIIVYLISNKYLSENLFKNYYDYWNERLALFQKCENVINGKLKLDNFYNIGKIKKPKELSLFQEPELDFDTDLLQKLKELRTSLSKEKKCAPYMIFKDKTLEEMSAKKPKNTSEFLNIKGVGPKKVKDYGELFLNVINF
jgi:RecQ family ATP-dependent DNA helicase